LFNEDGTEKKHKTMVVRNKKKKDKKKADDTQGMDSTMNETVQSV
jgi:hypothetical protein